MESFDKLILVELLTQTNTFKVSGSSELPNCRVTIKGRSVADTYYTEPLRFRLSTTGNKDFYDFSIPIINERQNIDYVIYDGQRFGSAHVNDEFKLELMNGQQDADDFIILTLQVTYY